jgi:hypothetical protein
MRHASDILREYSIDPLRDDDVSRWYGNTSDGDFKLFKQALRSNDSAAVQQFLTDHDQSPELSCTYNHPHNHQRWWYGANMIENQTSGINELVVEIGAGSHATVAHEILTRDCVKCYIICDLVTPLLLAYYNLSKNHQTYYVRPGDSLETLIETYRCILLPHHLADKLYTLPGSIYYNSYSLSEMSLDEIDHYMDIITTTNGRLLSENYMTGNGACHLCGEPYRALGELMPRQLEVLASLDTPTPTNTGSQLVIAQA